MNCNSQSWSRVTILYLLIFTFCFFSNQTYVQAETVVDSLIKELPYQTDSAKVFLLIDISIEMTYVDTEKAKVYCERAYDLAKEINLSIGIGRAQEMLGHCYHLLDEYEQAELLYQEAFKIFVEQKNEKYVSSVCSKLAQIYGLYGDYPKSIEYYNRALEISRTLEGDLYIGTIIFGLAENYTKIGFYKKAFALLEESLPLITYEPHLIYYYAILGDLYCTTGAIEEGLTAFFKSAELCETHNDEMRLAYIYEYIAKAYFDLGVYEKTADYYFKIIEINQELNLPTLEIISAKGLGSLYKIWNEQEKSIHYFEKALKLAKQSQLKDQLVEIKLQLADMFLQMKAFAKTEEYIENALQLAYEIQSPTLIIKAHLQLCDSYLKEKKYTLALNEITQIEQFLVTESEDDLSRFQISIYAKKGEIYFRKKKYLESISILEKGLSQNISFVNKKEESNYFRIISNAYAKNGNYKESLNFYQAHTVIEDSIRQTINNKEINAIRVLYETKEKEQEIEKLQQEKKMQTLVLDHQKSELSRKQSYLLVLIFLLLLLVLSSYFIFNRLKWRKKTESLKLINSKIALEKQHLKTRQQLEIAKLRSHLFTNISHEFRTPLTLILSPLESMVNGENKVQPRLLKMMYNNAQKLLGLVNQTLDLAKLESGKMGLKKELCNIDLLIRDVFQNFLHIAQKRNILLKVQHNSIYQLIEIDKVKMERAISNLLSNALRFSSPGSTVWIILQDRENGFEILIRDEGEGIPPEHQSFIFDRYYQVDKYSDQGTGIGLALTKEIIELHGGRISVESQVKEGTTFTIILPFEKTEFKKQVWSSYQNGKIPEASSLTAMSEVVSALENSHIAIKTNAGYRILIVEDNQEVMDYLTNILSTFGVIRSAKNGQEALRLTRQFAPDLIICDIMMPVMDGVAFTKVLKKDIRISHIPIILLTAKASLQSKLEGLEIGVDDYLTKPFNSSELLLRSKNLILQRRKLKQLFKADKTIDPEQLSVNKLDQEFLEKALSVVKGNLQNSDFNVERFTGLIGMSRTNLYTKLRALTGKSILEFIRTLRIQEAVELIKTNSGNMNEIAYQTGFNNRQSFIKSFKLEMGKTPSEYKKSLVLKAKAK